MRMPKAILTVALGLVTTLSVSASAPYKNYTYGPEDIATEEPQAYYPETVFSGSSAGTTDFSSPQDLFVADSGDIYIADAGNNRIVILNSDFKFVKQIDSFVNQGKTENFSNPCGVFVTKDNKLYIADTDNGRIVVLADDGSLIKILGAPKTKEKLSFDYKPIKVAVDFAERVYVVSLNCTSGIIEFDKDGSFLGYFGAVKTKASLSYLFWKSIATQAQKDIMSLVIPTEYSNLDIDERGFVYGTVSAIDTNNFSTSMFIHKLNPMGIDVLKRNGFTDPMGDVDYVINDDGSYDISKLCDVVVLDNDCYSVLDANKGRIFTYNSSGELLFIFGGLGDKLGTFGTPVAIDCLANKNYLVLDSKYNQIVEFAPTDYADLIWTAIEKNKNRDYDKAADAWMESLKYTSKSCIVFKQIGNAYYNKGNYKKAMMYYKLAYDNSGYSDAFKSYRLNFLSKNFSIIMTCIIGVIILLIIINFVRRAHRKERLR